MNPLKKKKNKKNKIENRRLNNIFCIVCLSGLAAGFGDGHPVQSHSAGEYGRRAARKVARLPPSGTLRQSLSHQRLRQRTRSLPGQFHQQPR